MIAVLGWTDGFGNDTYVNGIYPTLEEATKHAKIGMKYVEFDFGEVYFDYYEANDFHFSHTKYPKNKKKKR
jgi:hypothetical protein